MCELLGMSANVPTDICFSFTGLAQRGGKTGPHKDGWGIAFYEGKGCRVFQDPQPSVDSPLAELVRTYPIRSHIVISHIRKANRGKVDLKNTHPFLRELWGSYWTFAHNGQLKGIKKEALGDYLPVGTTDSEYAFCWILSKLKKKFRTRPKDENLLSSEIRILLSQLGKKGVSNILLSDSKFLFAYCSTKLVYITRTAPFGEARLIDADMTVDFRKHTGQKDVVTVLATTPLTQNEIWTSFLPGEFQVWKEGKLILRYA
ncbi:class II glutamine amidotransferase [Leptospira wolffii]|uniref:Class II glutamine amidotransferase n=1 Tax=Leptospira wolffii TaxID=409998 RepID=A0A2M9Z9C3_9LEPT|nr:class II glutamine amidotransferase [Leptospira wolffii]EPG65618.1 glutamine amidotransferases class-II [Leptospira wolffii serovar Khorat str. Khorat-H2]PJZ65000.1 class II glutamine amidotransferase [Leptospira wolffii]TGK58097.1 class II glutamine amidotransferase [Leptospira wolffii]TGK68776.1 class II glutamine amidotransferase [Leptospira wolffii]TGK76384.1 class II glutamine amidotransferase [Leptospira wolffii]